MENDGMTRHKIKCQFWSEGDDSDPPSWDTLEYFCWPISLYCYWFCLAIPRRTHVRQDLWWGVNDGTDWMVEKNKLGVRNSPWAMCAWPSPAFRTGRCVGTSFSLLACFSSLRLSWRRDTNESSSNCNRKPMRTDDRKPELRIHPQSKRNPPALFGDELRCCLPYIYVAATLSFATPSSKATLGHVHFVRKLHFSLNFKYK